MKLWHFAPALAALACAMLGCSRETADGSSPIRSVADLRGRRCGVVTGSAMQEAVESVQKGVEFCSFNDALSMVEALRLGKVDAVPLDTVLLHRWAANRPGEFEVVGRFAENPFGFFFRKGSPLRDRANGVLTKMKASGELRRIVSKWCDAPSLDEVRFEPLPRGADLAGRNGTLRFVTNSNAEPGVFVRRGELVGFDVDIARRIAGELDMGFELQNVSESAIVPAVQSGKADMGGGCITITASRAEVVDFSDCYLDDGFSLLVKAAPRAQDEIRIVESLKASFVRTFVTEDRWKMLANGFGVTLLITVLAALLGTVLAFPVWLARTSRLGIVSALAKGYIAILQGTPVLVLLMVLFYVIFGQVDIDGLWIAVIGFGLNLSAYAGEMLRSGIESVPRGQAEAALALGYTPRRAFFRFVLPQAVRTILPVYRGEVIGLLKMTSIVGYIAICDLTKSSDLVRSRTYESFFPIVTTALVYFVASWAFAFALERAGRRLDPASKRKGGVA